jgi:cephalosporin hydroxylase
VFDREAFEIERAKELENALADKELITLGRDFLARADTHKYGYYWNWMGLPILQMPEDIALTQEILWETKPDFVIEAGIAWGGSLAMYAAFQELQGFGKVIGIDVTIPEHNRDAIMSVPVSHRIELIQGSSIDPEVFKIISSKIPAGSNILLVLDSNHTHEQVLAELKLWSPLLQKGNYIIVSDTIVEVIPTQTHRPRPWGHGNNPMTGMLEFLGENNRFSAENVYSKRAFSSFNPGGYLECIS